MNLTPRFYKQILDHLGEAVYFVDKERKILYWNRVAEKITGYSSAEVVNSYCYSNLLDHIDEKSCPLCQERCPLAQAMETGQGLEKRIFLRHKDGHRVPVNVKVAPIFNGGKTVGAVEVFTDASVVVQVEQLNEELRRLIHIDPLTQIPNRRALMAALDREYQRYKRYRTPFALIFVDIDHFKRVNDTLGHAVGDRTLQWFSRQITESLRRSDMVARFGGEEFIILLTATEAAAVGSIAESLRQRIADSPCPETGAILTASLGATGILPGDSVDSLLERADAAQYISKKEGRNRTTVL